ncbi:MULTISPECIES: type II secretion system F family protein [unclassified Caulobacter]|uniref:type II secretion system F family protein n=1 Tax=unclassified Caulobacter TaxID=2648921 RepID=UPI000D3A99CB|nr:MULTISPECIES: type II secretion system F family protein [unclassified Caulobacter]PTS83152.1 type II secretion system protein [Caulobacter sp. HMWF009]PTT06976.1 type II secretion system protein [Caulobacter sp. HMWF025]
MDIASTLTNPSNLLSGFIALVVFLTILTLAAPMMKDRGLEGRLKSVANRREELRRRSREALAQKGAAVGSTLRHADEGLYKNIVDRLQLSKLLEDPKVVDKLAQAGFRGPQPVSTFYFFRFVMPFVFAVITAIYIYLINDFGLVGMQKMCACMAALAIGYYAPNVYISNVAQKRRESIVAAFPDSLDLLLICVESGMSIEAAIQKVGAEVGSSSMELAEEMSLLTAELSYLPDRRLAYEGLARRTNHPGIKSVSTAMIQAERYGTPLGAALRVMAKENRELRLSAAEKKAAALPAQLTVPMILFFLPVLFVVILGPAIIKIQDVMGKH